MAIERRNPLPPGRYWVDVFDRIGTAGAFKGQNEQQAFRNWLRAFAATVKVEVTETHDTDPPRDFYVFRVTSPTPWQGPGLPSIAGAEIKESADTVERPPLEKDPLDKLGDSLDEAGEELPKLAKSLVLYAVLGGLALVFLSRKV